MNLTQKEAMILLIDVTMDCVAIPLAAIFEEFPAQYKPFRDESINKMIVDAYPILDISAESAAEYLDEKVSKVICAGLAS